MLSSAPLRGSGAKEPEPAHEVAYPFDRGGIESLRKRSLDRAESAGYHFYMAGLSNR